MSQVENKTVAVKVDFGEVAVWCELLDDTGDKELMVIPQGLRDPLWVDWWTVVDTLEI